jgi:hypothetical protein
MVFNTPAMRVRVQKRDDLIANTARRVPVGTRKRFGEQRARFWPNPFGGAVLRAIHCVAKPGKPSRLALGFAPCGSTRKSSAARGASFKHHPLGKPWCDAGLLPVCTDRLQAGFV